MLNHAFELVDAVRFYIGERNLRSQTAIRKIGALRVGREESRNGGEPHLIFEIKKSDWLKKGPSSLLPFAQPALTTERLHLEPVLESHAQELWELFKDPELHRFVPFEPISLERQKERCAKWANRRSPDSRELWLNWAARDKQTGRIVAHLQAGVKPDATASIGYLVGLKFHRQGFAFEALQAVLGLLRDRFHVQEVRAWSDTRNLASHALAKKLGMDQVELIKNADHFKGENSDEFVFLKKF